MAYTWGEIQIESLKKMFLNNTSIFEKDLESMRNDNKYKIYLNAMPQAANEGIAECMKRTRPYIKTFTFTQFPIDNGLGDNHKTVTYEGEKIIYEVQGALSYYFEIDNKATVDIYVGEDLIITIESKKSLPGEYKSYKGFIENEEKKNVRLEFYGTNPFNIRNVALYFKNYNYGDNNTKYIPDYKPYNIYDLSKLLNDFYKIEKIYHEDLNHELIHNNDYIMEDDYTLVIDDRLTGNFILKYQPYQPKITLDTTDDEEIVLPDEIAVILPLYIASQLYKDDDIAISTMYRNEFETALENNYPKHNDLKFISKSGWL